MDNTDIGYRVKLRNPPPDAKCCRICVPTTDCSCGWYLVRTTQWTQGRETHPVQAIRIKDRKLLTHSEALRLLADWIDAGGGEAELVQEEQEKEYVIAVTQKRYVFVNVLAHNEEEAKRLAIENACEDDEWVNPTYTTDVRCVTCN